MAKPAILIITELYPNAMNSFIGTFVVNQIRQLQNKYTIVVLTSHFIPLSRRWKIRPKNNRIENGLEVYSFSGYPLWIYLIHLLRLRNGHQISALRKRWLPKRITAEAKKLHRRYRFSLVHGHEVYFGDEAGPIGRALGIPSVFTLHGLFDYHLQGLGQSTMNIITHNISLADKLTAVSKIAAGTYSRHMATEKKFEIIPNGIVFASSTQPPDSRIVSFAAERPVLLGVGFFVREKRFGQIIRALSLISQTYECVLVLIGRGPEEEFLRAECCRLNLESRVLFLGEVKPSDMPSVYAAGDILVHPSVIDSFSMVCLEAMSSGLAVICTSNIGIVEYASPGQDIIVIPPDDESALTANVLRLLSNPTERQRIGQAAKKKAATMSIDKIADRMSQIYGQLI